MRLPSDASPKGISDCSIELGKTADFVVLGDNFLTAPDSVISDLPVKLTFVAGKMVYDRDRDGVIKPPEKKFIE